jgi:vacuolar protein sorting-associated protein 41
MLPPDFYAGILKNLLEEIENMLQPKSSGESTPLSYDLMNHAFRQFLCAVCAWGPTYALREKIRFHKHFMNQKPCEHSKLQSGIFQDCTLDSHERALQQRLTQSASCYLQYPPMSQCSISLTGEESTSANTGSVSLDSKPDSLFDVKKMISLVSSRLSFMRGNQNSFKEIGMNSKICLETLAELNRMLLNYEESLKCYLVMAALFPGESLISIETKAVEYANQDKGTIDFPEKDEKCSHGFVLSMIEHHHLHGSLMDSELLNVIKERIPFMTPLISLILLIGLDPVGEFLIDHCVPPPRYSKYEIPDSTTSSVSSADTQVSRVSRDGNESLPINFVAEQLRSSRPLLYWYLQLVFIRKPEMYVIFPTTAVPPRAITELHRAHLELHVDYAKDRDSAILLLGTEVYNQERKSTSLLKFLKVALPLGGIHSDEIRSLLMKKRSESAEHDSESSHLFALELAYVIENYGNRSEEESQQILSLYLNGAKSVMLAASYAQRNKDHTKVLWETLIEYCLLGGDGELADVTQNLADGTLFGTLLEAAALCGADLARLVTSIPEGMNIEGLRPRLVAAVADYRMKLSMHQAAANICKTDRITLLRELGHRSRRGVRHIATDRLVTNASEQIAQYVVTQGSPSNCTRQIIIRPSRHRLSVRLAMR